jgi:hypothetical protein
MGSGAGGNRGAELGGNRGAELGGNRGRAMMSVELKVQCFAFPCRDLLSECWRGILGSWCWLAGWAFVPRHIHQPARSRARPMFGQASVTESGYCTAGAGLFQ